jgi:excisionase family DNA binding protein
MTQQQRPAGTPPAKVVRYGAGGGHRTPTSAPKQQKVNRQDAAKANIPFADRITCNIPEACEVTGLSRSKLYELIASDEIETTTVGRRRLVVVRSLLARFGSKRQNAARAD